MSEIALPRARARRRKIKPPHPVWLVSVACALLATILLVTDILRVLRGQYREIPWAGANLCWLLLWWPRVVNDYDVGIRLRPNDRLKLNLAWACIIMGFVGDLL